MSAIPSVADPVAAWLAQRPPLTRAQKYDRLAFTFCKMGTVGLIAWLVTPPIFVLAVAPVAIYLYGRAVAMGITRSQCVLRRPLLIMGFWAAVAAADATACWYCAECQVASRSVSTGRVSRPRIGRICGVWDERLSSRRLAWLMRPPGGYSANVWPIRPPRA